MKINHWRACASVCLRVNTSDYGVQIKMRPAQFLTSPFVADGDNRDINLTAAGTPKEIEPQVFWEHRRV